MYPLHIPNKYILHIVSLPPFLSMRPPASRFPASVVIKPDHPLNVTEKEKYSETMDSSSSSNSSQLFLILRDIKYEYCLYRISEPENTDESTILTLGKPFLKIDKSTYTRCMSFVALGTSIYMVGGFDDSGDDCVPSNQMFICDTVSKAIVRGPNLVSGQAEPVLLTLGSKIYALTSRFFHRGTPHYYKQGKPGLQVLDTENLERGWSLLPAPPVRLRGATMTCGVEAYAAAPSVAGATSSAIFITLSDIPGTYAFDLESEVWDKVSQVDLPFSDYAMPIPPPPDLPCAPWTFFAVSSKTERFSAFRFWYNANSRKFKVDEVKISNSCVLSRELPPDLYHVTPLTVLDRFGRVYSLEFGFDDYVVDDPTADRYVKVYAAQVCQVKPKKMKRHSRNEEKEKDENVRLNRGMASQRCRTTKWIRNNEVEDRGEFKMNKTWSSSFFGGPMLGICEHICAAFAL